MMVVDDDAPFDAIVRAAIENRRCPANGTTELPMGEITRLVKEGKVRVEISNKNYRVAVVLVGPHRGKTTARDPSGSKPWKVIDAAGTTWGGTRGLRTKARKGDTQPWKPGDPKP